MSNPELEKKQIGQKATMQQRKASDPDKSVWVEASAGTGKTKVLSDRVLRILLKGVNPSRILCLTYTKAAAVEMSTRIAGRLSRWAVLDDEGLYNELESLLGELPTERLEYQKLEAMARKLFAVLLDTPGGMKIQTIHSFCQEVLKRFPLEAGVSPYFEVMDERASREALDEVKVNILKRIDKGEEPKLVEALAYLTTNVSEFKFPEIMSAIAASRNKITRLMGRYGDFDELLAKLSVRLGVDEGDTKEALLSRFFAELNRGDIKQVMEALQAGSPKKDGERAEFLDAFLSSNDFASMYEGYRKVFLTSDKEPKRATKGAVAKFADVDLFIEREAERINALENKMTAVNLLASTRAVLCLAEELIGGYNEYKLRHSKMDYEDLIVITRNLLGRGDVAKWVMYKLDGGIDNILIDEAQDTSPDQWEIVKSLTGDFFSDEGSNKNARTVFAVGDRKQSIYSFQGAEPQEFENMQKHFTKLAGDAFENVRLDVSFRSTTAVLKTVDTVFADEAAARGVALDGSTIEHVAFRRGDAGKIEFWPLIEPIEGENPDVWLPPIETVVGDSTSSRLAKGIAQNIKRMVESKEVLHSKGRPVRYKDFLILVQRRNSFVEELVRECKNANVNVAGVDKIKLLEQIAIQDLVALGQFLLLPTDDLTLATILKSPLFGLDDDDLFRLCYKRRSTLWSALGAEKDYAKVYETLQELLGLSGFVRPFELYSYVLNKLEGRKKFVERMGSEVEDGLDEFVNLTINFEIEHIPTLQGFVDWIAKDQVEIKRELEQSEADAVRIMTVHGSKGLQAPIVIMPDTVRVPTCKKEGGILWDDELLYFPLSSAFYEERCLGIYEKEKAATLEEYRRLLYVALTRAEDRLCVCGYRKKNKASDESWFETIKRTFEPIASIRDDIIVYETTQETEPKQEKAAEGLAFARPDFGWIREPARQENPLAKPYTPSKPEEDDVEPAVLSPINKTDESRYRRGKVIHKLLQFMPDVEGERGKVIDEFLSKNAQDLNDAQQARVKTEVLRLLGDERFAGVFGVGSKAEVAIMGEVDGKIISAQVDRLKVEKDGVWVVDFKTNRPAALRKEDVPLVYVKQMLAYKTLLQKIYPDKEVKTLILWTDTANLMEV